MTTADRTIYRGCKPVLDVEYSRENGLSPSEAIVDAVATVAGVDPLDLPPLYEFVDPDALNNLFDNHGGDTNTLLSFTMDTWNVFVRADGKIRVCDATRPTDPEPIFDGTTV